MELIGSIRELGAFPGNLYGGAECAITTMRKLDAYVSLLMAFVASFALVGGRPGGLDNLLTFDGCPSWGHAVPAQSLEPRTFRQ